MDITLAGGATFPHFDRLVVIGQWVIILGFIAQLTVGISRVFRGAAPELLPPVIKTALAWFVITHLPEIGSGAFKYGGLLAEAIAGDDRMTSFRRSIDAILMSIYSDGVDISDMFSIDFWLNLASVVVIAFAYVSKYIVLEILWPLYLGLVVISGTFSISLATLPGLRTAQSWVLTLIEAVSWPMIFQILLSVIAAVTEQQLVTIERYQAEEIDFVPMLEGLATLCAISFLTMMVPIIAARLMRGEGASAAMSFVSAKAATMVSSVAARTAVGAVTTPAKMAAGPIRRGMSGRASIPAGGGFRGGMPAGDIARAGMAAGGVATVYGKTASATASTSAPNSQARPRPGQSQQGPKTAPMNARGAGTPERHTTTMANPQGAARTTTAVPGDHPTTQTMPSIQNDVPASAPVAPPGRSESSSIRNANRPKSAPSTSHASTAQPTFAQAPNASSPSAQTAHRSTRSAHKTQPSSARAPSSPGTTRTPQRAQPGQAQPVRDTDKQPFSSSTAADRAPLTPPSTQAFASDASTPRFAASASPSPSPSQTSSRTADSRPSSTPTADPKHSERTAQPQRQPASPVRTQQPASTPCSRDAAPQAATTPGGARPRRDNAVYNLKGSTSFGNAEYIKARSAGRHQLAARIKKTFEDDPKPPKGTPKAEQRARQARVNNEIRRLVQDEHNPKEPS